ncbi:MAG: dipeptidase PepE [Bacteroidetes bacterium]|nr:dipeptidase PepE [Bacteroidota bacterium]
MRNLLLISNSTMPGEPYFAWPRPYVEAFAIQYGIRKLAFVPFAAVDFGYDQYEEKFANALRPLGIEVISVHRDCHAIETADAIAVGGGNTFALLSRCYEQGLLPRIRLAVTNGKPYMGWSAGANLACPYIFTTNDMPIVQPPSFEALGLVSFQINPHYTPLTVPGHGGESRDARLRECLAINPGLSIAALPEGTLLKVNGTSVELFGSGYLTVFQHGQLPQRKHPGDNLSKLCS